MSLNVQAKSYSDAQFNSSAPGLPSNSKALGGQADPALVQWFQDALAYKNAVEAGQATPPDPVAYQEFLKQIDWAKQQLFSNTAGSGNNWDPMAGESGGEPQPGAGNDFGGELGPDGNWSYDHVSTHIGFTGDNTRNDVFGTDNTLNLDMPSAKVTCETTTDQGVEVLKVTVTTAQGTAVYYYDNFRDPDFKLKINVPNEEQVTGAESFADSIEVAKFETSDPDAPAEGPEPSSNKEDNWYVYDGRVGEQMEFNPTAGEDEIHEVYGDLGINTLTSDHVNLTKGIPGDAKGFKIVVKHEDGSTDTFYVHEGFHMNINAVPQNVSFDGEDGITNGLAPDLDLAPQGEIEETTEEVDSEEGEIEIPESYLPWVTLNGQANETESETAEQNWPPALLDYFDLVGIDPEDYDTLNVPESLIQQIENGVMPPTPELLQAMLNTDSALNQAYQNFQANPEDEHAAAQLRNLLNSRLKALFPAADIAKEGEWPEAVEHDAILESRTLFFDGFPYEITEGLELKRVEPDPSRTNPDPGETGKDEDSLANAGILADIPGVSWTAEEIAENAKENDIDLSYISFPPSKDLWRLLGEIDTGLQQTLESWMSNPSTTTTDALRDHVVQIIAALYPDREVEGSDTGGKNGNHCNDLYVDGALVQIFPDSFIKNGPDGIYPDNAWQILANNFS